MTPGLIDPHTHLVFAGTREGELRLRQRGASYLEILAAGGGILSTVARTRAASVDDLVAHGRRWLDEMLAHGVTTVEAKSGYGLDVATELLRLLEVAARLGGEGPVELVPTFLGAHAVPPEFRGRPDAADAYVRDVVASSCRRSRRRGSPASATCSARTASSPRTSRGGCSRPAGWASCRACMPTSWGPRAGRSWRPSWARRRPTTWRPVARGHRRAGGRRPPTRPWSPRSCRPRASS